MNPGMDFSELIEHSILDSMGLLDEQEQGRFELAFRAAPAPIQAQVRREQTRLAHIDALLPDVTPPAGLRAAVIQAIRREREGMLASDDADLQPMPTMLRSGRVSPLWRAASLGLAAACLTLAVVTYQFYGLAERTTHQLQNDKMMASLGEHFGPGFVRDVLFSRDTSRVVLTGHDASSRGQATMFINPEWKTAKFFTNSMASPEGKTFRVALLDDKGNVVRVLKEFSSRGGLESLDVDVSSNMSGEIAVLMGGSAGPGTVVCRGTIPHRG
jgi:hypothetical protein